MKTEDEVKVDFASTGETALIVMKDLMKKAGVTKWKSPLNLLSHDIALQTETEDSIIIQPVSISRQEFKKNGGQFAVGWSTEDSKTDFIMTGVVFKSQDWWYGVASKTDKTDITTGTEESDTIDF